MSKFPVDKRCPCGTGLSYGECCMRFHEGAQAPTAESLMRSRFSAFVVEDADYLLKTWHKDTCPPSLTFNQDIQFFRLDVISTTGGGIFDTTGTVDFEAHYKFPGGGHGSQREHSSFSRVDGRWVYHSEI